MSEPTTWALPPNALAALLRPAVDAAATEYETLHAIAAAAATRIAGGGHLYAVGAGHSHSIAAELCHRAGGTRHTRLASFEDLRSEQRNSGEQLADSLPERDPANGPALLEHAGITGADALLVISNSGRNGATIELAAAARDQGTYVAAIVSRAHAEHVTSRHPSGRMLTDVVHAWVDNHGLPGDAAIDTPFGSAGSTSTIAGAVLAQLLALLLIQELAALGTDPKLLTSANSDPLPAANDEQGRS